MKARHLLTTIGMAALMLSSGAAYAQNPAAGASALQSGLVCPKPIGQCALPTVLSTAAFMLVSLGCDRSS